MNTSAISRILNGENIRQVLDEAMPFQKYRAHYIVSSERAARRSDEDHVDLYSNKILNVGDEFEMDGLTWIVDEIVSDPDRDIHESDEPVGPTVPKGPKSDKDLDFAAERIVYYLKKRTDKPTVEDVIDQFRLLNDDYDDYWARGLTTKGQQKLFITDLINRMKKYGFEGTIDVYEAKKFKGKGSGKFLNFDDDLVIVYDANTGDVLYKGLEDYEEMKDEDWRFDKSIGAYRFKDFIKEVVG